MSNLPAQPLLPCPRSRRTRRAFTLLEVILAVALSATLLSLLGTAISLYISRVEADRTRVEEAQLARSILTMITDDIRAATIYQPQDTKALGELLAASAQFNVDSIDAARKTAGAAAAVGASSPATALSAGGATSSGSATSSSGTSGGTSDEESDETLPLGLNGTMEELYVDVTQLPQPDELFGTVTGYTNAQAPLSAGGGTSSAGSATAGEVNPPVDLRTVRYYVRSNSSGLPAAGNAGSPLSATPAGEAGLVRQEIPRAFRVFAEQMGSSDALEANEVLIAPEVVNLQFRYFNGSELFDIWEMKEQKKLPLAIEVKIWLKLPHATNADAEPDETSANTIENAHEYRQIVYLPLASLTQNESSSATGSTSAASSSSSESTSSSTGASSSGSTFSNQ